MAFDFFKPAQQQPQQQQQQQPAPQQQQQQAPTTPGMLTPAQGDAFQQSPHASPQQTPAPEVSPLDTFKDLWNPSPDGQAEDPYSQPIWGQDMNNEAVSSAINKMNFFQVTPDNQELVGRALQGDAGAFAEVMNQAIRKGFRESMGMTVRMTDQSARIAMERMKSATPGAVVNSTAQNILFSEMPQVAHPASRAIAENVLSNLQQKNPTWTPNQVAEAAKNYFTQLTHAMNPTSNVTSNPNNPSFPGSAGSEDFTDFFAPPRRTY